MGPRTLIDDTGLQCQLVAVEFIRAMILEFYGNRVQGPYALQVFASVIDRS
jgi:hypothetical protein